MSPSRLESALEVVLPTLDEGHTLGVPQFDARTGTPSVVASRYSDGPSDDVGSSAADPHAVDTTSDVEVVDAARAHLEAIAPVQGLEQTSRVAYRMDPHPIRTSGGAVAVHAQQEVDGIAVFQADQVVRFGPDGRVRDVAGRSEPLGVLADESEIDAAQATEIALSHLASTDDEDESEVDQYGQPLLGEEDLEALERAQVDVVGVRAGHDRRTTLESPELPQPATARLRWFPLDDGLHLAWEVDATLPGADQWEVVVDAAAGEVVYASRLSSSLGATALVYLPDPRTPATLAPMPYSGFRVQPPVAAPVGHGSWVDTHLTEGNSTSAVWDGTGPVAGTLTNALEFVPAVEQDPDHAVINSFFLCNYMHDVLEGFGFGEAEGNFQAVNSTRAGLGGDRLEATCFPMPVNGTASMSTPKDGRPPIMRMGTHETTRRHAAFDATVIFHEYAHGLSNRLVGGSATGGTLTLLQSKALGEGWSDYVACTLTRQTVVGAWLADTTGGIRTADYAAYPRGRLRDLIDAGETSIHRFGEVWCAALLALNAALGAGRGLQVAIDGMKLTPANPTFVAARDAYLEALEDTQPDQGDVAEAWAVFARFGLGAGARGGWADGFDELVTSDELPS